MALKTARHVVLELPAAGAFLAPPEGEVRWEAERPSTYEAEVRAAFDGAPVVIRVSHHPGWRAYVDGREVPLRRFEPAMMAIDLPAGVHRVELRFRWPWWSWLLLGGTAAALAALALRRLPLARAAQRLAALARRRPRVSVATSRA